MDNQNKVSVVIVNHNAGSILVDTVGAALEQATEVIVVDNASSDSSLQILSSQFVDEIGLHIVRNTENFGFAAGCNIGVQYCTTQTILFLNPDCVLESCALDKMKQTLNSDPGVGMVGGLLLNLDGSEQAGARRAVPTLWRSFVRAFGLSKLSKYWPKLFGDFYLHKQPLPILPTQVEAISGALMLINRRALDQVGLWDERYFLHCEDLDLCMRFRQGGWNIIFDPSAKAVHVQGACSRTRPIFVEWHKHKGMARYYKKFFSKQYYGLFVWIVTAGIWLRFLGVAVKKSIRS